MQSWKTPKKSKAGFDFFLSGLENSGIICFPILSDHLLWNASEKFWS